MNQLRRDAQHMVDRSPDGKIEYDLRYVFTMMRHFLYSRPDSMQQTLAYQWRTTASNKFGMLSAFKDSFELGRYSTSSMYLIDEMKTIVVDGGSVGAEPGKKDDRVVAAALAHEAWRRWLRPRLEANGVTFATAQRELEGKGPSVAEKAAINYLRTAGIIRKAGDLNVNS
jgi:hypothetical protein